VTILVTLLAAFEALLVRYGNPSSVLVGASVRSDPPRTFLLHTDVSDDPTFCDLLARVREGTREAMEHAELSLEQMAEALALDHAAGLPPTPQAMLVLQERATMPLSERASPGSGVPPAATDHPDCDLALWVSETADGFSGTLRYDTDLFEDATIVRMAGHLRTLLEGVVADPHVPLSALPLLTEAERHRLLVEWNDTRAPYPRDACVHHLFERQVERTPDAVAIIDGKRQLTYSELNGQSNALARRLRELGVGAGVLVGICLERSAGMVVGLLAILKAGGAYVPLDPAYPAERLAFMIADTRMPVVLTREQYLARLGSIDAHVVCMEGLTADQAAESHENSDGGTTAENLAYVLYTSGSTGKPKGVLIPHRGLVNYLWWAMSAYGVAEGGGAPVHTSLGFDLTLTSLFPALLVGRPLVLLPEEQGFRGLAQSMNDGEDFSPVKITPAHLSLLNRQLSPNRAAGAARVLVIGGEALSWDSLEFWRRHAPATRLINEYGPTETVVGCCVFDATGQPPRSGSVPIGRPIANTRLYVLDGRGQPVPIGVAGELHIGGDGVGRGYLNRPELTAATFVPDPYNEAPGARLYKTGDLVRYLSDGNLEFLGRIDRQVKIRGFRVELGEIESVLDRHPAVRQSVVIVDDAQAASRLLAFVVTELRPVPDLDELRRFVASELPDYMVPTAIRFIESVPLTINGKVDHKALVTAAEVPTAMKESSAMPQDALERQLAAIWEQALHLQPVGARQSFFDLGGNSLLAAHVLLEIEQVTGQRLPLGALIQAPTIEALAALLRGQERSTLPPHIVALRNTGSTAPFFCVPGLGGSVLTLRELVHHMDPNQVIYALEAAGLDGGHPGQGGVEKLAAQYVEEIRAVQPEGPYFLGGFSFGGKVVFEMARQLHALGEEVAFLALIDSYGPGYFGPRALVERISYHVGVLTRLRRKEWRPYLRDRARAVKRRLASLRPGSVSESTPDPPYEPATYHGKVTLFRAKRQPPESTGDPLMGWGGLATGGVEVRHIEGDHWSIAQANARELAENLMTDLIKAQTRSPT